MRITNVVVAVAIASGACCPALRAQAGTAPPEPQYSGEVFALGSGGQLIPLEQEPTHPSVKRHNIPLIRAGIQEREDIQGGTASPVHLAPGTHFIVRLNTGGMDPATLIHLFSLQADKQGRYYVTGDTSGYVFTNGKSTGPQQDIGQLHITRYGQSSWEITPSKPLVQGEYAFISGYGHADCFQIDPNLTSAAAPPPLPAAPPVPSKPAVAPEAATSTGAAGDFSAGPGLPLLHTARTPDEGCHWEPLVDRAAHIALLMEHCANPAAAPLPTISSYKPGVMTEIIVFTKPATTTLDTAVRQQINPHLKMAGASAACHIIPDKAPTSGSSWKWYQLSVTSGPLRRKYTDRDIVDQPCDPWEMMDAEVSFLYRPTESGKHFLWVALGQEQPQWDVESIRFLP